MLAARRPNWYAIRTRSRHEKLVHDQFVARDIAAFLPLVERRRRWADRWKMVSFPLFPGYCFARFHLSSRLPVVTAVGVVEILGDHAGAVAVPDVEIESIMRLVTSTLPFDPHPYLDEGAEVEVLRGPLFGMRGIVVRKDRRARLVVRVPLIRQSASVELDADDVAPVRPAPPSGVRTIATGAPHDSTRNRIEQDFTGRCRVTAAP